MKTLPRVASEMALHVLTSAPVCTAVLANFNAERSGNIYVVFVVFEPHRFVAGFDGLHVASVHGSPWAYDTLVPVVFAGPGISARTIMRRIETANVAPTIAAYLRIKPPSGSRGNPLAEVTR